MEWETSMPEPGCAVPSSTNSPVWPLPCKEALAASPWPLKMPLRVTCKRGFCDLRGPFIISLTLIRGWVIPLKDLDHVHVRKVFAISLIWWWLLAWPCWPWYPHYGLWYTLSAQAFRGIWSSFFRSPGRWLRYHSFGFSCLMSDGFCTPVLTNYCTVPSEPQLYC